MMRLEAAIPLIPDGDEAREWAERELADPAYERAEPNALDRAAQAVVDFFAGLFGADVPAGWGGPLALVIGIVVAGIIVVAFLIWGRPRTSARASRAALDLFGAEEIRSAAELRRDADAEAAAGRWDDAIVLRFRALARGVAERGILKPAPGVTVHAFARDAARSFPGLADELETAAAAFEDVRYLRRPGSRALYDRVAGADAALSAARPRPAEVPV